jgi:hypothetical protein
MTTVQVRLIETGVFLFFMFLSGFWLSRAGKPYPGGKFNLHKFIGLGTGAFLIVMVYRAHQGAPLSAAQVTAVAITALLFILNVIAGGLVSLSKPMPGAVKLVHKVFPFLCAIAAGVTVFFLLSP